MTRYGGPEARANEEQRTREAANRMAGNDTNASNEATALADRAERDASNLRGQIRDQGDTVRTLERRAKMKETGVRILKQPAKVGPGMTPNTTLAITGDKVRLTFGAAGERSSNWDVELVGDEGRRLRELIGTYIVSLGDTPA